MMIPAEKLIIEYETETNIIVSNLVPLPFSSTHLFCNKISTKTFKTLSRIAVRVSFTKKLARRDCNLSDHSKATGTINFAS